MAEGLEENGFISDEARKRVIKTLKTFLKKIKKHEVVEVFAVGTAALRDSSNTDEFIDEIRRKLDIEVEILNGCGEPGVAARFSEFLRDKRVDVVRSENADNFDYENTILIQRNENTDGLKYVADVLKFDTKNLEKVKILIDADSDVDITLIIGKDFNTINTVKSYLNN